MIQTHTQFRVNSCILFHHCSMSRFWQLFRPALARKAGQLDPQTLAGSLVELSWHFPKLLHREALRREAFTQRSFLAHNDNRNCSSKTESRRHSKKKAFEAFCQEIIAALMHPLEYDSPLAAAKGSSITPNNRSSDELCCSHYSAICKD